MSETLTRRPKATLNWPLGGAASMDRVTITATVNQHPSFAFTAFTGREAAEGATPVLDSSAAELMGKAQAIAFSSRTEADTTVTIEDGNGGNLTVKGFLVAPSYQFDRNTIAPSFNAIGEAALIDNLRLDIYSPRFSGAGGEEAALSSGRKVPADQTEEPSLSKRLQILTDALIKTWQDNKSADDTNTESAALKELRHKANESAPLKQWAKLLSNSSDLDMPWLKEMAKNPPFNSSFNADLIAILRQQSRSFQDVLLQLNEAFRLMMVPGQDGAAGKFIKTADTLTGDAADLPLSSTSIFLRGGSSMRIWPTQQVIMREMLQPAHKTSPDTVNGRLDGEGQVVGAWPKEISNATGDITSIDAPFYLSKVLPWFSTEASSLGNQGLDFRNMKKVFETLHRAGRRYSDAMVAALVEDYCKSVYVNEAIGGTGTAIRVPLDLTLWPGKRYSVTSGDGTPLFEGFLYGVVHSFAKHPGGGEGSSELDFSHIKFPGFELPGMT